MQPVQEHAAQKTVTVIGAGVAGMSAACALAEAGFRVQLVERRGYLGGRASSYLHPGVNEVIDNCQHVLFGCCTNLIGFYRRIGVADRSLHAITGTPVGTFSCPSEQRMGALRGELDFASVESILAGGLHEFGDAAQTKMNTIDECISGDFFALRPLASEAGA